MTDLTFATVWSLVTETYEGNCRDLAAAYGGHDVVDLCRELYSTCGKKVRSLIVQTRKTRVESIRDALKRDAFVLCLTLVPRSTSHWPNDHTSCHLHDGSAFPSGREGSTAAALNDDEEDAENEEGGEVFSDEGDDDNNNDNKEDDDDNDHEDDDDDDDDYDYDDNEPLPACFLFDDTKRGFKTFRRQNCAILAYRDFFHPIAVRLRRIRVASQHIDLNLPCSL